MAYSGWLLKVGNYTVPMSFMKPETYSPYVNMQDLDDYTDANGYLHRNAVELKALKVEFETRAMLTNTEFNAIISKIRQQFTDATGRACYITAYIPEYDDYVTQYGYMADFQPTIYTIYIFQLFLAMQFFNNITCDRCVFFFMNFSTTWNIFSNDFI